MPSLVSTRRIITLAAASLALAGCGRHQDADPGRVAFGSKDTALTLGEGDVSITNADSSVELALAGNEIVTRLSEKVRAKVRQETDTSLVKDSGLGGSIERMVKSTVQSALNTQVRYPLADVKDVRYDNGELIIETTKGRAQLFEHSKVNGRPVAQSFRPEDAQRFIAAYQARKIPK